MNRYVRQMTLPEVGPNGQKTLRDARVLVVGAGGLGVPVLQYLVGAGIGHITLIDGDHIEEGNLHRQPLYRMGDIGQSKVEAAAAHLRDLNPECSLEPLHAWCDPHLADRLVPDFDLVLDCADTFAVSLSLSDACLKHQRPLISASALSLSGYVGGFCADAPSLRAIFPDLPQRAPTCATGGILGPVVGMMGLIQAQMALALLLKLPASPLGTITIFDAAAWRFSSFRFHKAQEPSTALPFIALGDVKPDDLVVDLRSEEPSPFTANALHLDAETFVTHQPSENTSRVVLACRTGLRAHNAGMRLRERWPGPIVLLAIHPSLNQKELK